MSAHAITHAPVRLLVADPSENAAQELDSLLRNGGIATRLSFIDDLCLAGEIAGNVDLAFLNSAMPDLAEALSALKQLAPQLIVILLNDNDGTPISTLEGLKLGATHVIAKQDTEFLILVAKREISLLCQRHLLTQVQQSLSETEARCELLLSGSQAAIAYVHEGMHIFANNSYLKLFGFEDSDDLLGLPLVDMLDPDSIQQFKDELKYFKDQNGNGSAETPVLPERCMAFSGFSSDQSSITGSMTLTPAQYEGENCIQITVRTDLPAAAAEVPVLVEDSTAEVGITVNGIETANGSHQATDDLGEFLKNVARATDPNLPCRALFIAAVDDFANIRSQNGIQGAGLVAQRAMLTLESALDGVPCLSLGPEQMAFFVSGRDRKNIVHQINDVQSSVHDLLLEIDQKTIKPSLSLGGVEFSGEAKLEKVLNTAYTNLLKTQLNRKPGSVEFPEPSRGGGDVSDEAAHALQLINEAIDSQKFVLLFQPIISLRGDADEHYEVFLRMLDRSGKQMAPAEFLRTAIENNVAGKIDRWVILQSIKVLSSHRSKGHNTRLTINISANSVTDPEFLQWLTVAIKAARLPSDAVIFQITEIDAQMYIRQTREFVEELNKMHCRASLSRFGVEDDPFDLLNHIPVDMVKLDGSHIEQIDDGSSSADSLTMMIKKLQAMGKLSIVPMVESATVLSALWQAGANYIQGHYLQEPSTKMDYDFNTDD